MNRHGQYYHTAVSDGHGKASDCIECGKCEASCPQHLPIRALLKDVASAYESKSQGGFESLHHFNI